ncbi:TMV resistance protein N [Quercus suber]
MAMVDMVYKLPALDYRESIQLFSWHAFGKYPPNENYMDLTLEVVYHARGLPLVVKLLGSCLFGKSASEWKNALKELKEAHHEMFETFTVSFHLLSDKQQKLFLNIALYHLGMEKNYTLGILQDSNLSLESELQVLCRRFLVTVDCLNRLTMHDMVREMGREIVRRQSQEEPGEYNSVWSREDGFDAPQYHTDRCGWPCYFHKNPRNKFFEGEAPSGHNMYSPGFPTMTSMSQTECLESPEGEQVLLEAEPQLLRRQLEDEQRAHLASCITFIGSWGAFLGVMLRALATVEHGGQVGMVFEMYRDSVGFFRLINETIE